MPAVSATMMQFGWNSYSSCRASSRSRSTFAGIPLCIARINKTWFLSILQSQTTAAHPAAGLSKSISLNWAKLWCSSLVPCSSIYFLITSDVTLSLTVPIYPPSLQKWPPQSCFLISGYCRNNSLTIMLFIICIILEGEYLGDAPTKTCTWSPSVPIVSNTIEYLCSISEHISFMVRV